MNTYFGHSIGDKPRIFFFMPVAIWHSVLTMTTIGFTYFEIEQRRLCVCCKLVIMADGLCSIWVRYCSPFYLKIS